jgi:dihydrofolate reductase
VISTHVYIGTSLDGFIARANGEIDWLMQFADDDAVSAYREFISRMDVIVVGRGTFETVVTFAEWPYELPVVVLSSSLNKVPGGFEDRMSLSTLGPKELVADLSNKGYRSAYIDGGKVIQSFLAEGLIDELIVARVPVLIGSGIPLFGHLAQDVKFTHHETRSYPNGLVRSYYRRED